jgi:hypothetical protein
MVDDGFTAANPPLVSADYFGLYMPIKLFPAIFRRVANPVEPFGFKFVQHNLPLPLLEEIHNILRQADDGQPNAL